MFDSLFESSESKYDKVIAEINMINNKNGVILNSQLTMSLVELLVEKGLITSEEFNEATKREHKEFSEALALLEERMKVLNEEKIQYEESIKRENDFVNGISQHLK